MSAAHHTLLAAPSFGQGWVDRVKVAVRGLAGEWRVQRDLRRLGELDACALHDIGLAPGGLEGAVRHGRRARQVAGPGTWTAAPRLPASVTEWR